MSIPTVKDKSVVTLQYTLKNEAGEVLDTSVGNEPLAYLHGADNIVVGLERALTAKKVGDKLEIEVSAQYGYGERTGAIFSVDRGSFPEDAEIQKGMQFVVEGEQGLIPLWVDRVEDDQVFLDPNHPLAGVNLHFQVEILGIRDAKPDEIEHGHPHGPGGHQH